jgi:hypothetical protein
LQIDGSKKQIRITCKGAALVPINKLEPLQPESFKTLSTKDYARLKAAILDVGFSFPELVWKHRDRFYIVDGHQRVRTVQQMMKEGHALPGRKLPVSFTEARNKKEALKKIGMGTSQYGKYDEESMYEFMHLAGLDLADLKEWSSLPQIHMGKLEVGYFKDLEIKEAAGEDSLTSVFNIIIDCESEQEQLKALEKLQKGGYKCRALVS